MNKKLLQRTFIVAFVFFALSFFSSFPASSQSAPYPDQQFIIETGDSLLFKAELVKDIVITDDGAGVELSDGVTSGFLILRPQSAPSPFNIGLPSWNGTAPCDSGGFRVLIRVPYSSGWSPWLDVGYWKANLWPSKNTSFGGGRIDIDIVELNYYTNQWQFAIELKRKATTVTSPTLSLLSFFISDSRTTQNIDYAAILNDKPEPIFVPTTFLAQYRISNEIGGRICSPTTVAMILLSYDIEVDPLQFALDTYDPYWDIFGVWPRVVQNASEYGVKGTVTRYRSWSEAREVLAKGGRIGMSIGQPLYNGHLVMLAGFTENGDPIVHDPARTYDGYAHVFNTNDLSLAWFDKGGVAYTFYLNDTSQVSSIQTAENTKIQLEPNFELYPNYPNPFNSSTTFHYQLNRDGFIELYVYSLLGKLINKLVCEYQTAGIYQVQWNAQNSASLPIAAGGYIYLLRFDHRDIKTGKLIFIK